MSKSIKRAFGVLLLVGTLIAPAILLSSSSTDAEAAVMGPVEQGVWVENGLDCENACSNTPCCFLEEVE